MSGKWDAVAFVQQCVEAGASLASLVPTQVFDLVAAKHVAPQSMRLVLVGGGALSAEIEATALQLGWPLRRTYGMTETASQVASQSTAGGDMTVLPIWDVSTDSEGVLTVRGESLAQGYAVSEAGQWRWEPMDAVQGLRTRDRVRIWQQGGQRCLRFLGREAQTVKILGELVALEPIQARIEAVRLELGLHKGEAVICDVPDARREARLVLVVAVISTTDAERLRAALNCTLRPFEQVEQFYRLPALPRSELGKVLLSPVRTQIIALLGQNHPAA
jgi:O-succinylbenzoic acid--CoA ligase